MALLCQQQQAHLLLHTHSDLLAEIPTAIGVHLPSSALKNSSTRSELAVLAHHYLVISTHNANELQQAWEWGADVVTLSPVQKTNSHPLEPAMGWPVFADVLAHTKLPVYALGGMTAGDIALAHQNGAQGVAGIGVLG